ncbi:MAG: hypothetical protein Q7T54_02955 [Candidatus Levybacteria bacterium]|nr:hypothetical protein [Candidatus Levybacteria bacterium]
MSNKTGIYYYGASWALSLMVFFGIVYFNRNSQEYSSVAITVIVISFVVGCISFICASFFLFRHFFQKKHHSTIPYHKPKNGVNGWLLAPTIVLLILVAYLAGKSDFINVSQLFNGGNNDPLPTRPVYPLPTRVEIIEPTLKPTTVIKKSTKAVTNDPAIHCSVHPDCGGGTIPLKQSECSNSTCCQINGKWIFYRDRAQCTRDQGGQVNNTGIQKNQANNYYCWNNTYGYAYYTSSGDQCNLDNLKSSTNSICTNSQKMKVNSCNSACEDQLNEDRTACAYAYTGSGAAIEQSSDKYAECLNGTDSASSAYSICLSKCTEQYSQDLKQCN